jgi:hypothetical protein
MRRIAFILFALVLFAVYGGVAFAAAPANDDIANAVNVTRLPFTETVDITDATPAPDDLNCGTLVDGNTAWYTITPSRDTRIGFHIDTSVQELSISIGTGSPGSLALWQCSFAPNDALDATGGTTYYIQVATCCGAAGGPVTISMQEVSHLSTDLSIDRLGRINDAGVIELSGKVRCNRQTPPGSGVTVQGTLTQGSADGWLVPVHFSNGCSKRWMAWSTTVQLLSVEGFASGRAALETTVFACDQFDTCAVPVTKAGAVRLR